MKHLLIKIKNFLTLRKYKTRIKKIRRMSPRDRAISQNLITAMTSIYMERHREHGEVTYH